MEKRAAYLMFVFVLLGGLVVAQDDACEQAASPVPADGATDVLYEAVLTWTPAAGAEAHDVYFGPIREYVERVDSSDPVFVQFSLGQAGTTYDPGPLTFGTRYYWRVDEIAADGTICEGEVWSFTVEPATRPLTNVTATASSSANASTGPENTVNGSGLEGDLHSNEANDMWFSALPEADPNDPNAPAEVINIQYAFDKPYKLSAMSVWNANQPAEPVMGLGAKDVTVQYSMDGDAWMTLGDVEFAQAPGTPDYVANTSIDLDGVMAQFVKLIINTTWAGGQQAGLSEVRFFYVPLRATEPHPASSSSNVPLDATLTWRPGREAKTHEVFLSTNESAVVNGSARVGTVSDSRFRLSQIASQLELGRKYYWKVNELDEDATPSGLDADVWSFTLVPYTVVEDFESYGDTGALRSTWVDGWIDRTRNRTQNGPGVLETSIVHSGSQALGLSYNNSSSPNVTEVLLNVSGKNWTRNGAQKLVIFFQGDAGNTRSGAFAQDPLYVRINGKQVTFGASTSNPWWTHVVVDLESLGVAIRDVVKLVIGVGTESPFGRRGTVFIDDVRLYRSAPSLPNLVELALAANRSGDTKGQFDTLIAALLAADPAILEALSSESPLTVFAPTDDAFEAIGVTADNVGDLDQTVLSQVLLYHVAAGKLLASDVLAAETITTLEGGDLAQADGVLTDDTGGQAAITATDVEASNGVIHIIDSVVLPYNLANLLDLAVQLNEDGDFAGQFDTLIAGVLAADPAVADTLAGDGQYTVFAPTDDAFDALGLDPNTIADVNVLDTAVLTDILLYHTVQGRLLAADVVATDELKTLQNSTLLQDGGVLTDDQGRQAVITVTDVEAINGVIHVIDAVVLPFALSNIVDLAIAVNESGDFAGQFDTLIAAVLAADPVVLETLSFDREFTVFAPTDDAFAALGIDADNVGDLDQTVLTNVLLYHVAQGRLLAADVLGLDAIETLEGSFLDRSDGVLTDDLDRTAALVVTDVEASNGVIHVIDAVVLPFELTDIVDLAVSLNTEGDFAGQLDTLVAAVEAADPAVLEGLVGPGPLTVFAPTDDAFAALGLDPTNVDTLGQAYLTDILLYHVAEGRLMATDVLAAAEIAMLKGGVLLQADGVLTDNLGGQATIVATDLEASNGVIHVIDAVVLPAEAPEPEPEPEPANLVEQVIALNSEGTYAGQFDTLIAAVGAADPGVGEALTGDGPLTVFAPTDDAFAALDLNPDNVGDLWQVLLTDILLYHVAEGKLMSDEVVAAEEIAMLKGGVLLQSGGVLTDNTGRTADIIRTDVEADNGVIHIISAVVLPAEL